MVFTFSLHAMSKLQLAPIEKRMHATCPSLGMSLRYMRFVGLGAAGRAPNLCTCIQQLLVCADGLHDSSAGTMQNSSHKGTFRSLRSFSFPLVQFRSLSFPFVPFVPAMLASEAMDRPTSTWPWSTAWKSTSPTRVSVQPPLGPPPVYSTTSPT